MPRVPPQEPARALQTFELRDGFALQIAAAEPLVADPVAMAFDEAGRLYIVEMRGYSERADERLSQIRRLEDTDDDGQFDRSTVFARDLEWPTAIAVYDGGVFAGSTPDILYLKDVDGDGVADRREVVWTGFGNLAPRLNVQALLNSFGWGVDNRLYGALGGNASRVSAAKGGPAIELRGRDFSFDPAGRDLRSESGGGQFGMCFDPWGRRFACSNSRHIQVFMYSERAAAQNPYWSAPPPLQDIAADGAAAPVYRISPDEPWRVIRTQWRVQGRVPGPIEGGGRASGYFTSATGIMLYTGDSWPEEYIGDAFIADCGSNLVHRKKLVERGVELTAERFQDESRSEFLASSDNWFRPVQMANGPDGNLYILDFYREIIEHPWSLPEPLKQQLDLNHGNDRGRIYRVARRDFKWKGWRKLSGASAAQLVETLGHKNGWHRDTAARLLCEKREPESVALLERAAKTAAAPTARFRALYVLRTLGALREETVREKLEDENEWVRVHALKLAEDWLREGADTQRGSSKALLEAVLRHSSDPSEKVRYQVAFTAAVISREARVRVLSELLQRDGGNTWMRTASLLSAGGCAADLLHELLSGGAVVEREVWSALGQMAGAKGLREEIAALAQAEGRKGAQENWMIALGSAGKALKQRGKSLQSMVPAGTWDKLAAVGTRSLADRSSPAASRAAAIDLVGESLSGRSRGTLLELLDPAEPQAVQLAAAEVLLPRGGEVSADRVQEVLKRWGGLTPPVRAAIMGALRARPERVALMLDALAGGLLTRGQLSSEDAQFLTTHNSVTLRERATRLLGRPSGDREQVIARLSSVVKRSGRIENGRRIYEERCASCHRSGGLGFALGPDMETVRATGKEKLLTNILDPSREIASAYANYLVETRDGEVFSGVVARESPSEVVLRQPFGNETAIARETIRVFRGLEQSLMPEGLEEGLSEQDVADLLEFLAAPPDGLPPR